MVVSPSASALSAGLWESALLAVSLSQRQRVERPNVGIIPPGGQSLPVLAR